MQDYNSLNAAIMICATLVNIQTDSIWTSLYAKLSQLSLNQQTKHYIHKRNTKNEQENLP